MTVKPKTKKHIIISRQNYIIIAILILLILFTGFMFTVKKTVAYTVQVPYDSQEEYTIQEPYSETVCHDIQVPYNEEECHDVQVPYSVENCNLVGFSYARENLQKISWSLVHTYHEVKFDIVNHENEGGYFIYSVTFRTSSNDIIKGPYQKYVYANSMETVRAIYDSSFGEDVTMYDPLITPPQKQVCSSETQYYTEQKCETVIKYRTVEQCEDITKYQTATKYRTIILYKEETRYKQVSLWYSE